MRNTDLSNHIFFSSSSLSLFSDRNMVGFPSSKKTKYHTRSNSLPSRPHPLISQCDEHLTRLRDFDSALASSSSSISHQLSGLEDLHECVDKLLLLPCVHEAFVRQHGERWVDELLDGSLRLLDMCSSAKEALIHTKECVRELHSAIRRRSGILENEVKKYLTSRKVVKRAIQKALETNKSVESICNIAVDGSDYNTTAMVSMLKGVEAISIRLFESLLCLISGKKTKTKSTWSILSVMHSKREISPEVDADLNEFANMDNTLHSVTCRKTSKCKDIQVVENVQNQLEKLELSTQDLEQTIELLLRRLIKSRVSLLNILSN